MHSNGKICSSIFLMNGLLSMDQTKSGSPVQSAAAGNILSIQPYAGNGESARSNPKARCDICQGCLSYCGINVEHLQDPRAEIA